MNDSIVSAIWLKKQIHNENLIILDCTLKNQLTKMNSDIQDIQIKNARYFDIKNSFSDTANDFPSAYPSSSQFEIEAKKLGINNNSIIVAYDSNGIYSSPRAWWLFKSFGHENVYVLNGGLPEWIKQGLPVEQKTERKISLGNFTISKHKNIVRKYIDVLENVSSKKELIIDVRSKDRFNGIVPEPRKGLRSGQIPNSINLPYTNVLQAGKFLSKENRIEIFKNLTNENRTAVFSCGSGITACIVYLASEGILTNQKAVYDGSWTEWGEKYQD